MGTGILFGPSMDFFATSHGRGVVDGLGGICEAICLEASKEWECAC